MNLKWSTLLLLQVIQLASADYFVDLAGMSVSNSTTCSYIPADTFGPSVSFSIVLPGLSVITAQQIPKSITSEFGAIQAAISDSIGLSNSTTTSTSAFQTYINQLVGLDGGANVTDIMTNFINFFVNAAGPDSSTLILDNFNAYVDSKIGPGGSNTSLITMNNYIFGVIGNYNVSGTNPLSTYVLSIIGADSGTTNVTKSVIAFSNFMQQLSGLSNDTLLAYNDFILGLIGPDGSNTTILSTFTSFITANAGASNVTDLVSYATYLSELVGPSNTTITPEGILVLTDSLAGPSGCDSKCKSLSESLQALKNWFAQAFHLFTTSKPLKLYKYAKASDSNSLYPVITSNIVANVIYYGANWNNQVERTIIQNYINGISSSSWWMILQQFNGRDDRYIKENSFALNSTTIVQDSSSPLWNGSTFATSSPLEEVVWRYLQVQKSFNGGQALFTYQPITTILLTSPEVTVSNSLGQLGTNYNGYHSSLLVTCNTCTGNCGYFGGNVGPSLDYDSEHSSHLYRRNDTFFNPGGQGECGIVDHTQTFMVVRKPEIGEYLPFNPTTSPNGIPVIDYMLYVLAHEISETFTDSVVEKGWFDFALNQEVADKCQHLPVEGAVTYYASTKAITGSGPTYLANAQFGGNHYLLPALYSPVSQSCVVGPKAPQMCQTTNKILCGSSTSVMTANGCSALGCCFDSIEQKCFYSNTVVTPATCPFIQPSLRLDCGSQLTSAALCQAAGCCWHDALKDAMEGPSCYRSDLIKSVVLGVVTNVPYVNPLNRTLITQSGATQCNNANGVWNPTVDGKNCYQNPGITTYTYKANSTTGITCGTINPLTKDASVTSLDSCTQNVGCWKLDSGSYNCFAPTSFHTLTSLTCVSSGNSCKTADILGKCNVWGYLDPAQVCPTGQYCIFNNGAASCSTSGRAVSGATCSQPVGYKQCSSATQHLTCKAKGQSFTWQTATSCLTGQQCVSTSTGAICF